MKKLFIAILILCSVTASAQNFFWLIGEINIMDIRYDESKKQEAQNARELGYFVFYPNKSVEVVKDTIYEKYDFLREKTIKFSYKGYSFLITYQSEPAREVMSLFSKDCLTILYEKGGIKKKFCDYYLDVFVDEYYNNIKVAQKEYEEIIGIALSYFKK